MPKESGGPCERAERAKQKMDDGDPIEEQDCCFALFEKQTPFHADYQTLSFDVFLILNFLIRNPRQTRHKSVKCRAPGVSGTLACFQVVEIQYNTLKAPPWTQFPGLFCS